MSLTERATAKISGVCPRYPLPERQWARRLERPLQQRSRTHFGYDCRFAITEVMFFIFAVENSKPELCERYEISRVPSPHRLQEDVQCGKRQHAGALFPGSSFGRGHPCGIVDLTEWSGTPYLILFPYCHADVPPLSEALPRRIFPTACSPSGRTECRFFESATQF